MSERLHYKVVDLGGEHEGLIEVYEDSIIISKEEIVNGGGGQAYSAELTWKELFSMLSLLNNGLEKC